MRPLIAKLDLHEGRESTQSGNLGPLRADVRRYRSTACVSGRSPLQRVRCIAGLGLRAVAKTIIQAAARATIIPP
jgi:hypothetical protein